jgi:hypothetical protein
MYKVGFKFKKHSPEILVVAGAVGAVASAVMACKASMKLQDILDKKKAKLEHIEQLATPDEQSTEGLSQEEAKKAVVAVHAQTGLELARLYGPSIALGAASLGCIFASHGILHKRNLAWAAAYASLDNNFKGYRKRLVERLGEDLDRELEKGIKVEEVEEEIVDENGKKKKIKKKVEVKDPEARSDYARCFDETCYAWTKSAEDNKHFLNIQQNVANERLQRQGFLFLNDVYEMLGFQKSSAGQVVGWLYRPEDPTHEGDNYVSFDIFNLDSEAARRFVNGYERSIWLDFNIDGVIYNKI